MMIHDCPRIVLEENKLFFTSLEVSDNYKFMNTLCVNVYELCVY